MRLAPSHGGAHRFRRIALAVDAGGERPAELGPAVERWHDVALEVGEAELADEAAGQLLLDRQAAQPGAQLIVAEAERGCGAASVVAMILEGGLDQAALLAGEMAIEI